MPWRSLIARKKILVGQISILFAGFALLELLVRAEIVGQLTLSAPSAILQMTIDVLVTGVFFDDLIVTLTEIIAAFLLAVVFGVSVGLVLWRYKLLQQILDPYLIVYYAMPIFVFYPMLVAIFGLNRIPVILIAFAMSTIAIIINTANGLDQISDVLRDVGRSLNLSRQQMIVHIYLPAAIPYIFTGLKLGFIYATVGVISSEFILSNIGLGFQISESYRNFNTTQMYAAMTLVIVFAVVTNGTLIWIEKKLYRRQVT